MREGQGSQIYVQGSAYNWPQYSIWEERNEDIKREKTKNNLYILCPNGKKERKKESLLK